MGDSGSARPPNGPPTLGASLVVPDGNFLGRNPRNQSILMVPCPPWHYITLAKGRGDRGGSSDPKTLVTA
ncbi:MAG: hypothetical protein Fur0042_03930 [Cyanophyceae cyanobacterium]